MDLENMPKTIEDGRKATMEVQLKALDDIINVNSLFTIAVFVGLAFASPHEHNLEDRVECNVDLETAQRLVLYEVVSFAFFLLSSLSATTCKVILNTRMLLCKKFKVFPHARGITMWVSAIGSFFGVVFMTLSMINVVQIKIGKLSCGNNYAIQSVVYLCAIMTVALLLYGPHIMCAVWCSISYEEFNDTLSRLDKEMRANEELLLKERKKKKDREDQDKKGEDVVSVEG